MASNTLYILLCSGEHEKVQMAAMMASVAAVSERPVEVFISMNALLAFAKDAPAGERYHGGAFSKLLKEKKAPDPMTLFRQGKELGDLKLWACSMALDVRAGRSTVSKTTCSTARWASPSFCPTPRTASSSPFVDAGRKHERDDDQRKDRRARRLLPGAVDGADRQAQAGGDRRRDRGAVERQGLGRATSRNGSRRSSTRWSASPRRTATGASSCAKPNNRIARAGAVGAGGVDRGRSTKWPRRS